MVNKPSGGDRIADLLDAYGSDVSRWPAEGRAALEALSPEARAERLGTDAALDQLLKGASEAASAAPAPEDLMARILAAAPAREATGSGEVVELRPGLPQADAAQGRGGPVTSADQQSQKRAEKRAEKRDWPAVAALLAACLVLGIFVGSTERGQVAAQNVAALVGLGVSDGTVQMTALDDDFQFQDDEDIL